MSTFSIYNIQVENTLKIASLTGSGSNDVLYADEFGNIGLTSSFSLTNVNSGTAGYLAFYPVDGATLSSNGVLYKSSFDNILIGTQSDNTYKLDVNGSTIIRGSVSMTGLSKIDGTYSLKYNPYTGQVSYSTASIVANFGNNKVLVSDNTPNGATAQSYLTFDGSTLVVGSESSVRISHNLIDNISAIKFNLDPTYSATASLLFYDKEEEALAYYTDAELATPIHIGREIFFRAYNYTGATISKGQPVYISGGSYSLPIISLCNSSSISTSKVDGIANDDIGNNKIGVVISDGVISNMDMTNLILDSTPEVNMDLYISDTISGYYISNFYELEYTSRGIKVGHIISTGSNGRFHVHISNENLNLSISDRQRNIIEGNANSTGVFNFSGIFTASSTTFNIGTASGWIVKNTYTQSAFPEVIIFDYPGATGVSTPYLLTDDTTYILISQTSSLVLQNTYPTPEERRDNIYLGRVTHHDDYIIEANNLVDFSSSPMSAIRDIWTPIKLIKQGIVPSANGNNLNINISSGELWGNGINFVENQKNPNKILYPGTSSAYFRYVTQDGGTFSNTITIDPGNYDNGGVITPIGGGSNTCTNQRIYLFSSGRLLIQYGQTTYNSLSAAVTSAQNENFVEYQDTSDNAILIGILSLSKNATDLSDSTQAIFNSVSKFGEVLGGSGGLSTTTLQLAYNNTTAQPEILTNNTFGAISFRRGSTSDQDIVFEVQNNAGVNNFYVTGAGSMSVVSLNISSLTGSGSNDVLYADEHGNIGLTSSFSFTNINSGTAGYLAYYPTNGATLSSAGILYWDASNNRLGIGTASPEKTLDINGEAIVRGTFSVEGSVNIDYNLATGSIVDIKDNSSNSIVRIESNGGIYLDSYRANNLEVGSYSLFETNKDLGNSIFIDYYVNSTLDYMRSGNVTGVWNASNIEYTETSTTDIGGDTSGIEFIPYIIGNTVSVKAIINSGTWSIKFGVRIV